MGAHVLHLFEHHGQSAGAVRCHALDKLRAHTQLQITGGQALACARLAQRHTAALQTVAVGADRQKVHTRRTDEVAHKAVAGPLEQFSGRAHLHRPSARHHHHLLGKGQRLHLVVGHINQGQFELVVDLLELAPQLPFQVRVDHGERLIKEHGRHIRAHQPAPQRYFLLGIGTQARGALVELAAHVQHLGNLAHPFFDLVCRHTPVAQREAQVLGHGHGVVNHRELEHLRDIARLRRGAGDVLSVKVHRTLRGHDQPRHDVEHGGFAAARRPQQGVRAAVLKCHLQRQQGVILVLHGLGFVGMGQVEFNARHLKPPPAPRRAAHPPARARARPGRQTGTRPAD